MMHRTMFGCKIHRATVTHADLHYEGSITIDSDLMRAANLLPYEAVHVWNITNGSRLQTYALEGPAQSGIICINGAGAHLNRPGDLVIIATFITMDDAQAQTWHPRVIRVDANNAIISDHAEIPGPQYIT